MCGDNKYPEVKLHRNLQQIEEMETGEGALGRQGAVLLVSCECSK